MSEPTIIVDALPTEPALPAGSTTGTFPVTVEGVRLDTFAYNITAINRATPARRARPVERPGVHGVAWGSADDYDAGSYNLTMLIRGTTTTGAVPGAGSIATYRANLDAIAHLLGKGYGLLDVRETVAVGVVRQCFAEVVDAIMPSYDVGSSGEAKIGFTIPGSFWQDVATFDQTINSAVSGTAYELTDMAGSTAPLADNIYLVGGPIANPRLNCAYSGSYVSLARTLASTEQWRVNTATWSSKVSTTLTLASTDDVGTDVVGQTRHGRGSASFLTLHPVRDSGTRKVRLRLAGTGTNANTLIQVRGRRKFLV